MLSCLLPCTTPPGRVVCDASVASMIPGVCIGWSGTTLLGMGVGGDWVIFDNIVA